MLWLKNLLLLLMSTSAAAGTDKKLKILVNAFANGDYMVNRKWVTWK